MMEMKYTAAVPLDGFYELVVASEGVKPYIGHDRLPGIDDEVSKPVINRGERLAVLEGTPDKSVILVKGRPDAKSEEIYRFFQVKDGELVELDDGGKLRVNNAIATGNWAFSIARGTLEAGFLQIRPQDWGYCRIIEEGWSPTDYKQKVWEAAGSPDMNGLYPLYQLIGFKDRAETAEAVPRQIAEIIGGPELLAKTEGGHLTDLITTHPGGKHYGAAIADQLHDVFGLLCLVFPDLQLPQSYIKGIRHK